MTVRELTDDQMDELKQNYLTQHMLETEDRIPSYDELSNAAEIVPDWIIFDVYDATVFSNDDFTCSAEKCDDLH